MLVTIGKEVFDFLVWKVQRHSFYARRSDGELRAVALIGSGLPLWATRFRCEFPDGTVIGFERYEILPLTLSEISQLENLPQESAYSRERRPAEKRGKKTPALSAKRAAAARKGAKVTDPTIARKSKTNSLGEQTVDSLKMQQHWPLWN